MGILSEQEQAKTLLRKYLLNACTPAEADLVEKWYASLEAEAGVMPVESAQLLQAVKQHVLEHIRVPRKIRLLPVLLRAAVVLGFLCATFLVWQHRPPHNLQASHALVVSTGKGVRKTGQLPDGTTVTLNAASTLTYASNFRTQRHVTIQGEAFFEIHEDPLHPFTVDAGDLHTQVLGTSFNVQAYAGEENMRIAVATGKVLVRAGAAAKSHEPFVLKTGEQLDYDTLSHMPLRKTVDVHTISAWRWRALYFEGATIATIAHELERQYDRRIVVQGGGSHSCRYTLHLDHAELPDILHVLSQLAGIQYTTKDSTIIINTLNCM